MPRYTPEKTYTLEDLSDWNFEGVGLAVLGHPVRHSISPQMHNAALDQLAAEQSQLADWRYFRFEVPPDRLADTLPLFLEKGFHGLNLTVPHKELALDQIARVDPAARQIGAVNTLKRTDDGYHGYNTDGYGLSQGIQRELRISLAGAHVVLLGAGGAARAAAFQSLQDRCASLTIVNRSQDRLKRLIQELAPVAAASTIPLQGRSSSELLGLAPGSLIINATSLGLRAEDPPPLPPSEIPEAAFCYDMIYNPPATPLMKATEERDGKAANGLSMLVHQGARSLEIWTNLATPDATMQQAALKALER